MPKISSLVIATKTILLGRTNSAAAVQSILTKFLAVCLNASTSIIVARVLRPEGRGEMSALIVWSSIFVGLLTMGLPSSLIYNLRQKPAHASRIVGAAFVLSFAIAAIAGLIGYFFVPFWLSNYSPAAVSGAKWFLLSTPIPIINVVTAAALQSKGKFAHANTLLWMGPLLTLVGLAVLAGSGTLTPVTAGLVYVLASVPVTLWLLTEIWSQYAPQFRNLKGSCRELLHYGVRSWGTDLLYTLSLQADLLLIVHFLNAGSMGVYVVAANLARLLGVFQTSGATILFPRVAARGSSEVISLTGRTLRIATMCAALGALALGLVGSVLLRIIYGPVYADSGTLVFRILLLEVVLAGATDVLAQAFMALGRPGVVSLVQGAGIGVGVALMPFLIPHYGITGAGLALLISTTIRFTLTLLCFRPLLRSNPPRLLMTREDFSFAAARVGSFLPVSGVIAD
jgi:O-antigen/teichoic acid export membrane protein